MIRGPRGTSFLLPRLRSIACSPSSNSPRRERGLRFDNAIQKPRLREKIDRLRLINGRAAQNPHANFRQRFDGALQIRGAIAKIRPERKIDELAVRHTENETTDAHGLTRIKPKS